LHSNDEAIAISRKYLLTVTRQLEFFACDYTYINPTFLNMAFTIRNP